MAEEIKRYILLPKPAQLYMRVSGERRRDPNPVDLEWFILERLMANPLWAAGGPARNRLQRNIEDAFDVARDAGRCWTRVTPSTGTCGACLAAAEPAGEAAVKALKEARVFHAGGKAFCRAHLMTQPDPVDLIEWTRGPLVPFIEIKDDGHKLLVQCIEKPKFPSVDRDGVQKLEEGYGLHSSTMAQMVTFEDAILNAQTNPPLAHVVASTPEPTQTPPASPAAASNGVPAEPPVDAIAVSA